MKAVKPPDSQLASYLFLSMRGMVRSVVRSLLLQL